MESDSWTHAAVVDSLDHGGAEAHVVGLAAALAKLGHRLEIACSAEGALASTVRAEGIPVHALMSDLIGAPHERGDHEMGVQLGIDGDHCLPRHRTGGAVDEGRRDQISRDSFHHMRVAVDDSTPRGVLFQIRVSSGRAGIECVHDRVLYAIV